MTTGPDESKQIWYFQSTENGEIAGPCSLEQLQIYYKGNYLDGLTFVWKEGMVDWVSLSECDELKTFFYTTEDEITEDQDQELLEQSNQEIPLFLPPDELPETYKYLDAEGNTFIFDSNSSNWISLEAYTKLFTYDIQETFNHQDGEEINDKKLKNIQKRKKYRERIKAKKENGAWLDGKKNPNVYVTGLPQDVSFEELEALFKKAGIIKIDPETTRAKIRIYKNDDNTPKGDALISFAKEESVPLAIKFLDDYEIRPNIRIHVEKAQFNKPMDEKVSKKRKRDQNHLLNRRKYLAAKYEQERLISWGEDMDDGSGRRIVLLKPMFTFEDAERYEDEDIFYSELKEEIEQGIEEVVKPEKVTPIARHPQGIVAVKFKSTSDAEQAIVAFRGRFFAGNELEAYFYDGKTDLKAQCLQSRPSEQTRNIQVNDVSVISDGIEHESYPEEVTTGYEDDKRLQNFGDWLEDQSSDEEFTIQTED